MSEQHRYFPDWTLRALTSGPEIEAEGNSYLAGGYAEEFGYRARISYSADVSELDGAVPEIYREQRSRASPVHPGYPLKAQPVMSDLDSALDQRASVAILSNELADRVTHAPFAERSNTFVVVTHRNRLAQLPRAAVVSKRLAAALVALRWARR
jgi:hypothetical protein